MLSRRRFLVSGLLGLVSVLAAACAAAVSSSLPSASSATSKPTSPPPTPKSASPSPAGATLRERIGQMLVVGFRGLTPDEAKPVLQLVADRHARRRDPVQRRPADRGPAERRVARSAARPRRRSVRCRDRCATARRHRPGGRAGCAAGSIAWIPGDPIGRRPGSRRPVGHRLPRPRRSPPRSQMLA